MLPGSQSSKLKQATLGISGDPRFQIMSTLPKSPWVFVIIVAVALVVSVVVMVVSGGALSRQANVVAVHECVSAVHGAIDAVHLVVDEERAAASVPCFAAVEPIGDPVPDQLMVQIQASVAELRRVHQAARPEEAAVRKVLDDIDEFGRWYLQNKAHYGIR